MKRLKLTIAKVIFAPSLLLGVALSFGTSSCKSESEKQLEKFVNEIGEIQKDGSDYKKSVFKSETKVDNEESSNSSNYESSSNEWDKVLADYESFIDAYIKVMKKVSNGDMNALADYPDLLEKAEKLDKKIEKHESELTKAQMKKYIELQTKFSNAMVDMM